jgi:hypothetical protein
MTPTDCPRSARCCSGGNAAHDPDVVTGRPSAAHSGSLRRVSVGAIRDGAGFDIYIP